MDSPQLYGVVVRWFEDRKFGMILLQNALCLPFQSVDFNSGVVPGQIVGTLIRCQVVPHPFESKKFVCRNVEALPPAAIELKRVHGKVLVKSTSEYEDGRVQGDQNESIAYRASVVIGLVKASDRVICTVVDQRISRRLFALRVEPLGSETGPTRPPLLLAGATRKGSIAGKAVNDDAFLVTPLAGGEYWLAAVSDGVGGSRHGWWASSTCMELIWHSRERFEREFVEDSDSQKVILRWISFVHDQFVRSRNNNPRFEGADATLVMAVGKRGDHTKGYSWAVSGDSKIYEIQPTGKELRPVIRDLDFNDQREESTGALRTSIGANPRVWNLHHGNLQPYGAGTKIILCTDGVCAERSITKKIGLEKRIKVHSALAKIEKSEAMQSAVEQVLIDIAAMGEGDDLTLVVIRP